MANQANNQRYRQSQRGVITRIYNEQIRTSKERKHISPDYSRDQLSDWMYANGFIWLYINWKQTEYDKQSAPSCDRVNSNKPYTLNNLTLITWEENRLNYHEEIRQKTHKHVVNGNKVKVNQYSKSGILIKTHLTKRAAAIAVNRCESSIHRACYNQGTTCAGYIWRAII